MIEVTETPFMLEQVKSYAKEHMNAAEPWMHGEMRNCWVDDDGVTCIQYEDACWWHYRMEDGQLKWW